MDCFIPIRFRTSIQLAPSEMSMDFNHAILSKLRKDLEGICTRFGYIKPNSIQILQRSVGVFVKQHFNGHIRFEMVCKAEVCNPPQGMVVKAVVRVKNEMGVLAESSIDMDGRKVHVLDIIVPLRAAGIVSDVPLHNVEVGQDIYVSVLSKRFQLRDTKISVIGKAVPKPHTRAASVGGGDAAQETNDALDGDIDKASVRSYEDAADTEDYEDNGGSDDESIAAQMPPKALGAEDETKIAFVAEEEEEEAPAVAEEEEEDADLYGGDEDFDDFDDEDDFGDYKDDDD